MDGQRAVGDHGQAQERIQVRPVRAERRFIMGEEKKVPIYDPTVGAFREVSLDRAIMTIKEAKKLEAQLLASGILTAEVKVD